MLRLRESTFQPHFEPHFELVFVLVLGLVLKLVLELVLKLVLGLVSEIILELASQMGAENNLGTYGDSNTNLKTSSRYAFGRLPNPEDKSLQNLFETLQDHS